MNEPRSLTRARLASAVQETVIVSNSEAASLVDNILKHMCRTLSRGDPVTIMNFGAWRVLRKAERLGRNPKSEGPVVIEARHVLTFKASEQFRERVRDF